MSKREKKKKRKGSFGRNLLTVVLILISLALIFNTSIRNFIIGWNTNKYQISNVTTEDIEKNKQAETTFDFDQVQSISTEAILAAQWDAQRLPVIGGIAVPELGINLPIFKGVFNTSLMYGAGTMKENQEMGKGNYALASHHIFGVTGAADVLFSPLDRAKNGMKIYITDKTNVYTYVIDSVEIVSPESVYVIDDVEGRTEVTLVTCTDYNATQRIIVKGVLESTTPYNETAKDILDSFNKSYNQYDYGQ
ncbi:TPA: class A sortase [Streptococcus suis]|uniref:class A sortase n=1 Tax=Streptococcus suis TaxID=1307 RepID=UPI00240F1973|nr:class A sortase [Streptococcus suis]MDG3135337.1 class A sortase [Streptococcus suis]HEM3611459.1 class A sortase [Streptococcus suis]HEM3626143.1 class A sortase [Streptococcus suis]HEM3639380.1 class A sortase [Streptococcus suis]HEM3642264.1 class A sortase [Streptococcus suis]